ncbi:TetR/AcrR family transcriptional regulator [Steroidobacter sp. S1-65]|uniref:TetR/AcrR family transcriptional regulator n=1 Tax=Steroidobacter gossypii TaxID=2805490 RepID=A0ABS1WZ61_9GAMM|nr:TetR/AcrR family transcriptional regulator [Steroidobacter gossypii]MBM0106264.1 TetR/AcrR family transcriptional regulator [Steroidobacter gossypii]
MTAPARARGRPRTKPAELRREELLDAAQRLFLAKGIAGTSIDDIVSAAHVAKGTFYLYFASKEAILTALQERFVNDFCARLDAAMERCGPNRWRARLQVWVKTIIEGYLDQVALHDVIFHEIEHYDRKAMSHNPAVDQLTDLLTEGAKHGAWKAEHPRSTAVMLFHAFHGGVDAAIADNSKINRARLTRMVTTFVERALEVH